MKDPSTLSITQTNKLSIKKGENMFDSDIKEKNYCPHLNTEWITVGGHFTSYGEADDDIREILVCLDCGEELPRPEPEAYVYELDQETIDWIDGV